MDDAAVGPCDCCVGGRSSSSINFCLSSFISSVTSPSPIDEERRSSLNSPSSSKTLTSSDEAKSASSEGTCDGIISANYFYSVPMIAYVLLSRYCK